MADLRVESGPQLTAGVDRAAIGLARAESTVQTTLSTTPVDLSGSIIRLEVPDELDVWIVCRVPYLGCTRRGAVATVHLTDEHDQVIDSTGVRAAIRHDHGFVTLDELVPAGSGTIVRKLRGLTSKGTGFANLGGAGRVTMDAFIR